MSELQAGPELDALIGEKIMGLKVEPWKGKGWCLEYDTGYTYRDDYYGGVKMPLIAPVPAYSTDIASVWQVWERLTYDRDLALECWGKRRYRIVQLEGARAVYAEAETGPLAICHAALVLVKP